MTDTNTWKAKHEWLDRLMASKHNHAAKTFGYCIFKRAYDDKLVSWPDSDQIREDGGYSSHGHFKEYRDALVASGAIVAELGYHTKKAKTPNYRYTINLDWDGTVTPAGRRGDTSGTHGDTSGSNGDSNGVSKTLKNTSKEDMKGKTQTTVANAPLGDEAFSLQGEPRESLPCWGTVLASENGDLLFEVATGDRHAYLMDECGVSALPLPETRTAAPVGDSDPIPTDAVPPSPHGAELRAHRTKWAALARRQGGLTALDGQRRYNEEKAINERHGVTVDSW